MNLFFLMFIHLAVTAVLGGLWWAAQRSRPAVAAGGGSLVFRYPAAFRWFAVFAAFGIPLGITVLVVFNPPRNNGDAYAVLFLYALFAGLSGPLWWEASRYRLVAEAGGVHGHSPWRGHHYFAWDEVRTVSFSRVNQWFIIHGADGRTFRISTLVGGVPTFLDVCERRLTPDQLWPARHGYERIGRTFPGGEPGA